MVNFPKYILVLGSTLRRMHTFHFLLTVLRENNVHAYGVSTSLDGVDVQKLQRKHHEIVFHVAQGAKHAKQSTVATDAEVVIVEASYATFLELDMSYMQEGVVILADIRVEDELFGLDVTEKLQKDMQVARTSLMLYNMDTVDEKREGFLTSYLQVHKCTSASRVASFGQAEMASICFALQGSSMSVRTKEQHRTLAIPTIDAFSQLKLESLYATLALLEFSGYLQWITTWSMRTMPMVEDHSGDLELMVWTKPVAYPDEFDALLKIPGYVDIAMGLGNYLKFEEVVEGQIERFHSVLVIAETDEEEELLAEYFLQKEHDSYHSVIFVPDRAEMRTALQRVFRGQQRKILYLFQQLETFVHIHE